MRNTKPSIVARVRRTAIAATAAIVVLAAGTAPATAADTGPTGPLAAEMKALLELQPGGLQVSDNALMWSTGTAVVWPSPGQEYAPTGIGANVRTEALKELGVEDDVAGFGPTDVQGCPSGWFKDYYCFYPDQDFKGRRLQFTKDTRTGNADQWGFNNATSGWVNTDTGLVVIAYDGPGRTGPILWTELENRSSGRVSPTVDNRMSSWTAD